MNGGLHIKQENLLMQDHHGPRDPDQIHHVIKREMHSEYDDLEHDPPTESMAEDLTVGSDHTDPNVMDA